MPGCAAEVMTVPLAVKDLRPLRGAFGVLDREPPARHRQNGGAGQEPASRDAAQPSRADAETRIIQARFRATGVPEVTWAAPVGGGERLRSHGPELGIRRPTEAPGFSSKQPVAGSSPARRAGQGPLCTVVVGTGSLAGVRPLPRRHHPALVRREGWRARDLLVVLWLNGCGSMIPARDAA